MQRILSLVPAYHVGFAYFEGPHLIDWGIRNRDPRSRNRVAEARHVIDQLTLRCDADLILLPASDRDTRRPRRKEIVEAARKVSVPIQFVSGRDILRCFGDILKPEYPTKHRVMARLAEYYPAITRKVPKPRRHYDSQDYWFPMFDAAAQAFAWKTLHEHA